MKLELVLGNNHILLLCEEHFDFRLNFLENVRVLLLRFGFLAQPGDDACDQEVVRKALGLEILKKFDEDLVWHSLGLAGGVAPFNIGPEGEPSQCSEGPA